METASRHPFWMAILSIFNIVTVIAVVSWVLMILVDAFRHSMHGKTVAIRDHLINQWIEHNAHVLGLVMIIFAILFLILLGLNIWQLVYQHQHQLPLSGALITLIGTGLVCIILFWYAGLLMMVIGAVMSLFQLHAKPQSDSFQ